MSDSLAMNGESVIGLNLILWLQNIKNKSNDDKVKRKGCRSVSEIQRGLNLKQRKTLLSTFISLT